MASIGILGEIDCGKTSCFRTFSNILEERGDRVLKKLPGGGPADDGREKISTITVDFLRFTYQGFIHVLYGTGGHKNPSTTYYRDYVLRNASRFLCIVDLSAELEGQLVFFNIANIPTKNVVIIFNKFDLASDNLESYKEKTIDFFKNDIGVMVPEFYPTIGIPMDDEELQKYNQNCFNAIISLCAQDKPGYGSFF
ncbi:MAG: GTPase domain-containing protein [Candidatus Hodarchaeales archaeon]